MSIQREESDIAKRLKDIYETTQSEGWKHILAMFENHILNLKSIDSLADVPKEEKLAQIEINSATAKRLQEILDFVTAEFEQHVQQEVDEIRVYGGSDFGIDDGPAQ